MLLTLYRDQTAVFAGPVYGQAEEDIVEHTGSDVTQGLYTLIVREQSAFLDRL